MRRRRCEGRSARRLSERCHTSGVEYTYTCRVANKGSSAGGDGCLIGSGVTGEAEGEEECEVEEA